MLSEIRTVLPSEMLVAYKAERVSNASCGKQNLAPEGARARLGARAIHT
jgi:hypothetical protein